MPPAAINIDDLDPSIAYTGNWQQLEGSTRQWGGGTVHSTTQTGASASITFSGTRLRMYVTLLHGLGNEIANIHFNGQSTSVSMPSQPTDVYNDVWFDSGELPSGRYTFVVSNGGGPSDTPFQLDRFNIEGLVETPSASAPVQSSLPPVAASSPSPGQTEAPQPGTQTAAQPTLVPSSPDNGSSTGAGGLLVSTPPITDAEATSVLMASGSITTGTAIALGQTTIVSIQLGQGVSLTSFPAGGSPPQISASSLPTLAQPISRKIPLGVLIGGVFGGSLFLLLLILLTWYFRHRKAAQRHVRLADECPDVLVKNRTLTAITPFRLDIHSASTRNLLSPNVGSRCSNSSFLGGGISASSGRRRSIEKPAFSPPETPRYLSSPSASLLHETKTDRKGRLIKIALRYGNGSCLHANDGPKIIIEVLAGSGRSFFPASFDYYWLWFGCLSFGRWPPHSFEMGVNVDDTDSSIRYSGDWDEIVGSTRQWGAGTVHSTSQRGASATITFTGTRIVMYCTLFHGTGNEIANINFDGTTTTVSKPSQSEDVYNDVWFDSGEVLGVQHTLVVSNGGGSSDTPLQLDQFFIEGTVDAPSAPPPPPPPPPTSTPNQAEQKTATTTQITTAIVTANSAQSLSSGSGSSSSEPRSSTSGFETRSSCKCYLRHNTTPADATLLCCSNV
ncbi:hypothetical protein CVT26_014165 [Gymnopilus dilepis]|uniref:Uncharacterized protein n=1 Tax=Gymnopilus dilepis TaxID=231916 RepID=A0A409VUH3_9AGAR|nr:hypothetical protein CVT26_014165 [Gymnopilus dilepis]